MGSRRFTRLTNGFSKKLDNHVAAVALYVAHYNLCRTHEALRMPSVAIGSALVLICKAALRRSASVKKPRHNRPGPSQQPQQNNPTVQHRQIVSAGWSGPLPPPAALDEFNRIVPGAAERIFAQFEAEGAHRRELELRQSKFLVRDVHVGQFLAGLFAMGGLGCLRPSDPGLISLGPQRSLVAGPSLRSCTPSYAKPGLRIKTRSPKETAPARGNGAEAAPIQTPDR
jgi:uncharacterized membrane protein